MKTFSANDVVDYLNWLGPELRQHGKTVFANSVDEAAVAGSGWEIFLQGRIALTQVWPETQNLLTWSAQTELLQIIDFLEFKLDGKRQGLETRLRRRFSLWFGRRR